MKATSIGGVDLDHNMIFTNEFADKRVIGSVTPTLGGGTIIQQYTRLEKGRPITLTTDEGIGFQRKSTVEALWNIANAGAGYSYTLTITDGSQAFTKTVVFRHELDLAIEADPIQVKDGLYDDDYWYFVKIYLMVV